MELYTQGKKVGTLNSWDELRLGANHPYFIWQGDKMVYPNPILDGLVLWHDFSGIVNHHPNKEVAEDLSGNGNHSILQNFNFTPESGYGKNKLIFDGVDDRLSFPTLTLDTRNMAVVDNGNVYSYRENEVTTINEEGLITTNPINLFDTFSGITHLSSIIMLLLMDVDTDLIVTINNPEYLGEFKISYAKFSDDSTPFESEKIILGDEGLVIPRGAKSMIGIYLTSTVLPNLKLIELEDIQIMVAEGTTKVEYNNLPSPQRFAKPVYQPQSLSNLLIYNRALTEEEIKHNHIIEKERFGIGKEIVEEPTPDSLPIGEAVIAHNFQVGGDI